MQTERTKFNAATVGALRVVLLLQLMAAMTPSPAVAQSLEWVRMLTDVEPSKRAHFAMAYDGVNGVVLFGGNAGDSAVRVQDTWAWNGGTWEKKSQTGPTARAAHAMAYNAADEEVVLFGGAAEIYQNDMWRWDGNDLTWTEIPTDTGPGNWPPVRAHHAMAYDETRNVVVLFGGHNGVSYLDDTWEWNGATWQNKTASGPSAREGHAMAYHPSNGIVLFGGGANVTNNETWSWNGSVWTKHTPPGSQPQPDRYWNAMAFDSRRERIVLFGGGGALNDTWEWDGSQWSEIHPNDPLGLPPPRSRHAMAFDPVLGCVLLFGGYDNASGLLDDTWVYPCELECGNGVVVTGEECDDGNTANGDGCDANCVIEFCGDGSVNNSGTEECDDNNTVNGDGCDENCITEVCGNNVVQLGNNEECDDANTDETDQCNNNCKLTKCGDGITQSPNGNGESEQCDDANTANGDGCDENCQIECLPPTVTAGISSRYIQIEPNVSVLVPMAFRIECGAVTEWVQLIETDYDDGGGVLVNIGTGVTDCASADFLTPDQWTNSGANALYVTGLVIAPNSKPTVTAVCVDCAGAEAAAATPVDPTWVYCDSGGDGQVTFVFDLFKQFANTSAGGGGPNFLGPDPGTEVDTQGDSPSVPDQQVTVTFDIFPCFLATTAGGSAVWTGEICP